MASRFIACVLKSGGDFIPAHVEWLRRQCALHMPDWEFICWSDFKGYGEMPLLKNLPKWWSKFEIYQDTWDESAPALVIDLDTVFVKPLEIQKEHENEMLIIRDPWKDGGRHPERLAGGFMYLPAWARRRLWDDFSNHAVDIIGRYSGDDQPYLHTLFKDHALRFQDHYIDEIVSYKVHVKALGLQEDNKVVYFHGFPRPWDVKESWIPCLYPDSPSAQVA